MKSLVGAFVPKSYSNLSLPVMESVHLSEARM